MDTKIIYRYGFYKTEAGLCKYDQRNIKNIKSYTKFHREVTEDHNDNNILIFFTLCLSVYSPDLPCVSFLHPVALFFRHSWLNQRKSNRKGQKIHVKIWILIKHDVKLYYNTIAIEK
jgi:hypothetical protein